jgi:hypothetical protein
MKIEIGMARREIRQPRDQPLRGEGGRRADRQAHRLRFQVTRGAADDLERPANIRDVAPPLARQRQHPRQALEQLDAELRLQPANLLRDGRLRHT